MGGGFAGALISYREYPNLGVRDALLNYNWGSATIDLGSRMAVGSW